MRKPHIIWDMGIYTALSPDTGVRGRSWIVAAGGCWFDPRHPQQLNISWWKLHQEILSCEKLPRVENAYRTIHYVGHSEPVTNGAYGRIVRSVNT